MFGMTLKSSSKHHTANMRLLLIVLTCLAASLALPAEKEKRGILPGDPRYDTLHHHHPETVVESARSIGYSIPDTIYGPPSYQPGIPLGNEYLTPGILRKTIGSPLPTLPLERIRTLGALPPATSYGTPLLEHFRTLKTFKTAPIAHATLTEELPLHQFASYAPSAYGNIQPGLRTYNTGLNGFGLRSLHTPLTSVQVTKTIPTAYEYSHLSGLKTLEGVTPLPPTAHSLPAVRTFEAVTPLPHTAHSLPAVRTLEAVTPLPSTVHPLPTVRTLEAVTPLPHAIHPAPPLRTFESFTSLHHPLPAARTLETVTPLPPLIHRLPAVKTVEAVTPLPHAVHPLPPVRTYDTYTALPQHLSGFRSFETVTPLPAVKSVETVTALPPPVHHVSTVKTVETVTPLPPAIHPLPAVRTLEAVTPLPPTAHPLPAIKTFEATTALPPLRTFEPFTGLRHHLPAVKTVEHVTPLPHTLHAVKTVQTLPTVEPVHHVETLAPIHHAESVEVLPPVAHAEPVHTVTEIIKTKTPLFHKQLHIQRGPHTFDNLPSFPSLPSLPSLPSFPSLPGFPFPPSSTGSVGLPSLGNNNHGSIETVGRDSITVENPFLSAGHAIHPTHNFIQPTDANGGYIY